MAAMRFIGRQLRELWAPDGDLQASHGHELHGDQLAIRHDRLLRWHRFGFIWGMEGRVRMRSASAYSRKLRFFWPETKLGLKLVEELEKFEQ